MTARTWAYIGKHVELVDRLDLLLEAIERPDLQEPDVIAGRERYWLRGPGSFPFRWLRVVIEFAGETDRVVTAFGQNNPPAGISA